MWAGARKRESYADIIADTDLRDRWLGCHYNIMRRCYNPKCRAWGDYGARGIKMHDSLKDRREFLRYVVTLPGWDDLGLQLDRRDNDGDYAPGNLRMVTPAQNTANTRATVSVEYRGERMCASDFWRRFCPRYRCVDTILGKIHAGASLDSIIEDQARCKGARDKGVRHSRCGA
jgi:hypothetical protein